MKAPQNDVKLPSLRKVAITSVALCLMVGPAHAQGIDLGIARADIGLHDGITADVSIGHPSNPTASASVGVGTGGTRGTAIDANVSVGWTGTTGTTNPTMTPPTTAATLTQPRLPGSAVNNVARIDLTQLIGNTLVSSDGMTLAIITAARYAANGNVELDLQVSAAIGSGVSATTIQLPTATSRRNVIRIGMSTQQFVNQIV